MIQDPKGEVTITNDGATILEQMKVIHPAAKMLVELSKAQDVEAGDGTTSVVVLCGSLLEASDRLLKKGLHPTSISEAFQKAAVKSVEILTAMANPVDLSDREKLLQSANTSLNSKVVSQHSSELSPIAVDAVLKVIDPAKTDTVNLKDIKVIKKLGGTVDDTELIEGLVLSQRVAGGVKKMEKAKVGLIQFQVSPPKTDMDNQVVVSDYAAMDRVLREERAYILNIVKTIKKSGCNVLLIQKSILRDALSDLAIHFLNKVKIMVVSDIERDEIEFISKTLGCRPIASLDHFTEANLVKVDLCEEKSIGQGKVVEMHGLPQQKQTTVSILLRASNSLMLAETERSLHDALCVVRSLVKKQALIAGAGAPETEVAVQLNRYARESTGLEAYCFEAYAEALEIIPYTLAENAALNPIKTVTELRASHVEGNKNTGISIKRQGIADAMAENVVQPLLVSLSAFNLATETTRSILKIDDIVNVG